MRAEMVHTQNLIPDESLREVILACFASDERTAEANLRVGVLNGVVHLAGLAPSLETWIVAAKLVEDIPGVRGVVNRIEAPGAPSPARAIHLDLHK